jgi:aquaporin Z
LWLFWVAPILGAVIAGVVYPLIAGNVQQGADAQAAPVAA